MIHDFYTCPPTYKSYINKLQELKRDFPFLNICSIGKSLLGRDIYAIMLGNQKCSNIFVGAFHAQEWLTTSLLIRYIEHLSLSYAQKTAIYGSYVTESLKRKGLIIIPMLNPDGVSIALEGEKSAGILQQSVSSMLEKATRSWQANARGIDLNHNFDAGFKELKKIETESGITHPCERQYGGLYPHSEPETKALVNFIKQYNTDLALAFHSQGEEIFYDYGRNTPPKSRYIAHLFYVASGYKIVENKGLYSHGGFKDYYIDKLKKSGFTIEIGKGENPLPVTDLEDIYDKLLELLVIATVL